MYIPLSPLKHLAPTGPVLGRLYIMIFRLKAYGPDPNPDVT